MAPIARKLISGMAWTTAASWASQAINFIAFAVLASFLDPATFGLGTVAILPSMILAILVTNGVPDAVIQRADIDPLHLDSAFWFLTALGFTLSALIWLCAAPLAVLFGQPAIKDLIPWTSATVGIQAIEAVQTAILRRNLDFRFLAVRNLFGTAAAASLAMAMAVGGYGVWSLVALQVGRAAFPSALLFFASGWRPRLRYSNQHCKELVSFGWPIVGQNFVAIAIDELPTVSLGMFLGPTAVGLYAFTRRPFGILWDCCLSPLIGMVMPTVARFRDDPAKISNFFNASVRVAAIISCSIFVGFAAIAPVAVPLVFGEQWEAAVPSIQIVTPLAILRTVAAICVSTIVALGYPKLVLKLNVGFLVLSALPVIVASKFSLEAMFITTVACHSLFLFPMLYFAHEIANVRIEKPLTIFPRLAIIAALMFVAVTVMQHHIAGQAPRQIVIAVEVILGAAVYIGAAFILLRPDILAARAMIVRLRQGKAA